MRQLPLNFILEGRPVLVIGGSDQAAAKARLCLAAGAKVAFRGPDLSDQARALVASGEAAHVEAWPIAGELASAALVVIAADADVPAERLAAEAVAVGTPVNVIDRADLSTALIPAIIDRGDVVVTVSTGGKSPVLARRLREQIEALLPTRLDRLAQFAADFRETVSHLLPGTAERRRLWEVVFDGPLAQHVLAGDEPKAREGMIALLNRRGGVAARQAGGVSLVGAGPGDPDLLTLKALQALQNADVILYDDLVSPDILGRARRDARLVAVGKRRGRQTIGQDEINRRLVEEFRLGHRVVRLKGGDPLVFGRGGEEIAYLRSHGIEPVIVPGITAALGCAAALGLPLTHRDRNAGLTLIAGARQAGADAPDWSTHARSGNTLAIYMGRAEAERIGTELVGAGLPATTPALAIENGTRSDQRVVSGTLAELGRLAGEFDGHAPVLLLVGENVRAARDYAPPSPLWLAAF